MKNSIIKQTGAFFAPALFLLFFTSSIPITDKYIKQQTSPPKEDTTILEVRTGDYVEFKNIINELGQPTKCEIFFIEKSTSVIRKHYKMGKISSILQEKMKEQDSCILISREGLKPLKINLATRKENSAQPIMYFLDIQLANSTSENVSKITKKQKREMKIGLTIGEGTPLQRIK